MITGSIWLGGAGVCIVGALYWKRGTAAGAWAALTSGAILSVGGFVCQKTWVSHIYPWLVESRMLDAVRGFVEGISDPFRPYIDWRVTAEKFPANSMEIYFITIAVTMSLYVVISLLTCRKSFNMERMLHRGKYRVEGREIAKEPLTVWRAFKKLLGIDSQYTRGDKIVAWSVFIWSVGWLSGSALVVFIWNAIHPWPAEWWATWFLIQNIVVAGIVGVVTTVWFTLGGVWDLRRLFQRLKEKETNLLDDGRVIGHVSASDVALVEKVEHVTIKKAHQAEHLLEEALEEEEREDEEHHEH